MSETYWARIREIAARDGYDGCSMALGVHPDCCLEHDMHYRTGHTLDGVIISRREADERFRACMQRNSWFGWFSPMAWIRWSAVRLFGGSSYRGPAMVLCLLMLSGCGPKAVFISGGQGSTASMDVSPMTGSGRISITGPFVYCSERNFTLDDVEANPTGKLCKPPKAAKDVLN